ncbi:MAG: choline kinase family protein [Actinomycetota bacterium]|nr:choline kinase family protein [Actinomycetota bacterium]
MGGPLDPDIAAAIAAVPEWSGARTEVTPITAGITNRNFRVDVGDESFVVRIAGRDTGLLGIDREAEFEAGQAAATAGVGPDVYAWLPEHSCLITRFVLGENIPGEDLQREDVLASVVGSVRAFHRCPPIPSRFPVFRIVENYERLASSRGVAIPPAFDEAHALAGRIEEAFDMAPMRLTTCHNDLLNANFLLDGEHTWIVDYEYAGMGDPFFDLGNLSINNGLSAEAQERLLRLYFTNVHDVHRARLALMRIMSDFREAMWGVVQQALSTLDFDYVDYADRHFARCLASATDERFEGWLKAAGVPV